MDGSAVAGTDDVAANSEDITPERDISRVIDGAQAVGISDRPGDGGHCAGGEAIHNGVVGEFR
jgi:hypothetical protein